MLSSRIIRGLVIAPKAHLGAMPAVVQSRFFAQDSKKSDKKQHPVYEVNLLTGEAAKNTDPVDVKLGGTNLKEREKEEVSGTTFGKGTGILSGKETVGQPKRSLKFSVIFQAKDKKDAPASKSDGEKFVSDSAKKNMNPDPEAARARLSYPNLEFYPEKPGDMFQNQASGAQGQKKSGSDDSYSSQRHNPSKTGREQDAKYLDEALSSKSGPLVGDDKGKRRFSTSAAAYGAPKGSDSAMKDAKSTNPGPTSVNPKTGKDFPVKGGKIPVESANKGIEGKERTRVGDDKKDKKGTTTDVDMGKVATGKKK